ncbi:hypothetical protein GWK47_039697 [Chionoecetes opilio]|uniref:Uncharacterized protein n=1 Tax=Chionoecetes opilio TaxID=41210 RepID=A0A8J4YCN9_CHIOP|nr:hypothetical protein GWK47_039697 [Chionoecetes opilio]
MGNGHLCRGFGYPEPLTGCGTEVSCQLRGLGVRGPTALIPKLPPDRTFRVVPGHFPSKPSTPASPRDVLGPFLWNVYFNDFSSYSEAQALLILPPLSFPCATPGRTRLPLNLALDNIVTWSSDGGHLALTKPPGPLISPGKTHQPPARTYGLGQITKPFQRSLSILGVEFYAGLTFTIMPGKSKKPAWNSVVRPSPPF